MQSLVARENALRAALIIGVLWTCWGGVTAQGAVTNVPPDVTIQPANAVAGIFEDIAFSAQATGPAPFRYQWRVNGQNLGNQTNASLWLTNLSTSRSGLYSVFVTDSLGNTNGTNAILTVQSIPSRRLGTGRIVQNGSQVFVPISLRASGREHALSFSFLYNTQAFDSPQFTAANPAATADFTGSNGVITLALSLPAGEMFAAGYPWIGGLTFTLVGTNGPLNGGLAFTTNPMAVAAVNTNGLNLSLGFAVEPQLVVSNPVTLNRQTGLFEQRVVVSNPGLGAITNIEVIPADLGVDGRTNAITLYNAQGTRVGFPVNDPLLDVECGCDCGFDLNNPGGGCDFATYLACGNGYCAIYATNVTNLRQAVIGNLNPGESITATFEYFVSDHVTVPAPKYALYFAEPFASGPPSRARPLEISDVRLTNGLFLVEFPTVLGRHYYVQYATDQPDLTTTNALTSFPPVVGTGSRVQWLDTGPPRTVSPPVNGSRFYRVLETP